MATIDRVLPPIPRSFDIAPSLQSLDCLTPDRSGRTRFNRFLEQLRAEAELGAITARLLRDAMTAGDPEFATGALDDCSRKARSMDQSVLRVLTSTVITPFDCEDIKGMSRYTRRIVESVAKTGHAMTAAGVAYRRWLPVQEKVLLTAEALVEAMDGLTRHKEIEDASRMLWVRGRELRRQRREVHVELIHSFSGVNAFVAEDAISRRFGIVAGRFRDVNLLLRKAKLKNG